MMKHPAVPYLFIALLGALLFIPFLGGVHLFDWDEINFAESAREMIATGDFSRVQINFQPFWEKPPLFIWMQVLSMKVFGVGEFAARLPNALCGIATLLVLFNTGRNYFSDRFGWLWVLAYAGSFLPHFYFKSGIIDPVFNLFIVLALLQLVELSLTEHGKDWVKPATFAGLFTGLAILTKGPVGLLITGLCWLVFAVVRKDRSIVQLRYLGVFTIVAFAASFLWYGIETIRNGPWFIKEFIEYHFRLLSTGDSGHGEPFYYHFVVLLIGCFPASILAFQAFRKSPEDNLSQATLKLLMVILLAVVLIIFSVVKTKIVHYSSLCYFPITFLAAYAVYKVDIHSQKLKYWVFGLLAAMGLVIAIIVAAVPVIMRHKDIIISHIKNTFAIANLGADVSWPVWISGIGVLYGAAVITFIFVTRRKGFYKGIMVLFISTMLLIQALFFTIVPRVEGYSQAAAIEYFQSLKGKDVYVNVLGYKSYAHFYYSNKSPEATRNPLLLQFIKAHSQGRTPDSKEISDLERQWQMEGNIDKPAYFCAKNNHSWEYRQMPQLKVIGEKNGFVFFVRNPEKKEK
jgi:4-amino-4-deoxy-L-arabinose transferase-like glycosyltransferase